MKFNFSSDTTAPVWPEIMNKFNEINKGHEFGYNQDKYTELVREKMQKYFTKPVECFMLSGGSACNILAIKSMRQNYSAIVCVDESHINNYEVGGTEYNTGCKILACDSPDCKLTVDMIKQKLQTVGNFNYPLPTIVVISQLTELGTCYTNKEIKEVCDFCHKHNIYVYVDGVRLANALVNQKTTLKEMLEDTGVDIAVFGGNKNGFMFGEMLIYLNTNLAENFILNQKQSAFLFSKTRFLSSQFLVMLKDDLWKKRAKNANDMATYLKKELAKLGIKTKYPVEGNIIYAMFNKKQLAHIKKEYKLSDYDTGRDCSRLMTNWATTKQEVNEFIEYFKKCK